MKRRHEMPFGAQCEHDGSVRFRLWAPGAHQVELRLEAGSKTIALDRRNGGWFELTTMEAKPGSQYYFRIDGACEVPDPAARFQPQDVHGPSEVVAPQAIEWRDHAWRGRSWEEAVIYELHVGAFTASGTFSGVCDRLDYLAGMGITAIELMPVADFPGKRNWGYDGVLPFAPDSVYGRPEDLKELVQSAHERGMMVFLDVVYNHFGPEGNYLNSYAPQFFTARHQTPWGNAINFEGPESRCVRDFFIHNALYWLIEYHFDGLRLDAVHEIVDDSTPNILTELAETVRSAIPPDRHVHLILENDGNQSRYLRRIQHCRPREYTAQWNDDIHHALHVLITGEHDGYYLDYANRPLDQLGRCLAKGFAYQGEPSSYRNGQKRGEPTAGLPPSAFVSFLQNHDQIGNRAFGERIVKLAKPPAIRAAAAILLLAPSPPMLFMGEESAAETPFLFFCNFENELAEAVTSGRRNEFARFPQFNDPQKRQAIPDPNAVETFEASRLDWNASERPKSLEWLNFYRQLLKLRRENITPLISGGCVRRAGYDVVGDQGLHAYWTFPGSSTLTLLANLGDACLSGLTFPTSQMIYASDETYTDAPGTLPPWSVRWFLKS